MSADTQIKAIFARWERLEGEKKAISDDLKELFSEAKHAGYDGKALRAAFNRKVKQDAATPEDAHFDAVVDVYLDALNGVAAEFTARARDARMHARENIEEFDPETGEFKDDNTETVGGFPVAAAPTSAEETGGYSSEAARVVAENVVVKSVTAGETASNSNPVANTEEEATGAIAAASNDPASRTDEDSERQHSSTVGFADDCRTGGKEQSDASAAPVGDAAADAHGIPEPHSPSDDDAIAAVNGKAGLANVIDVEPSSSVLIAPAPQGEAEAPASTNVSLPVCDRSGEGANTGGDHVTAPQYAATHQAGGLVQNPPAKPLRPNCLRPENCGGYGSNHCFSCKRAAKANEDEEAA